MEKFKKLLQKKFNPTKEERSNHINILYEKRITNAKKERDKALLNLYGCIIICDCGNELISTNSFVDDQGTGPKNIVKYKCKKCGKELYYNFDVAPAPLRYGKDLMKIKNEEDLRTIMEGRLTSLKLEGNKSNDRTKKERSKIR